MDKELLALLKSSIGCTMRRKKYNGFEGNLLEVRDNGDMKISCSNWWENINDENPYMPVIEDTQ